MKSTYEGRNKARRQQQQIYMNRRSMNVTLAPLREIGPRGAIQRNTTNFCELTKSERNVGTTKRDWSKGNNPEDNTTKTLRNPEDDNNTTTSNY